MIAMLMRWFSLAVIQSDPNALHPDNSTLFGYFGVRANLNAYASRAIEAITTAGTAAVLSAAQAFASVVRLDSGASGDFTLTLPATTAIFAALPPTVPLDGTFSKIVAIANNNTTHTATLTAGDASTTITGTATIATNFIREYLMTITGPSTITYENLGTKAY